MPASDLFNFTLFDTEKQCQYMLSSAATEKPRTPMDVRQGMLDFDRRSRWEELAWKRIRVA
jgi:hypothetical protein